EWIDLGPLTGTGFYRLAGPGISRRRPLPGPGTVKIARTGGIYRFRCVKFMLSANTSFFYSACSGL
ncbi:MAG: hypothetical protein PVI79_18415, partial [Gammaproteobacteria bacterium]